MRRAAVIISALAVAVSVAGCADQDLTGDLQVASAADLAPPEPEWRKHFEDLSKGAILVNLDRKFIAYWEPYGTGYHVFPIAVPLNFSLRKTGLTEVARRKENPEWRPTPEMRERMPDLPEFIGPGPDNPLGTRALYLGWQYYAIHGTNDPRSIGNQVTSGCIRLRQPDILWLYDRVQVGTPVRVEHNFSIADQSATMIDVPADEFNRRAARSQTRTVIRARD